MVLSETDKIIIKNDFEEFGHTAYRICKDHPSKNWVLSSVKRLIQKIKSTGSIARKPGSGRPVSVATEENAQVVEELILSQEEQPGTHLSPRTIERTKKLSRSTVRRIVKKLGLKSFKRVRTPQMKASTRLRRKNRAALLAARFERPRTIERAVWQDEKLFTLQPPINTQNSRLYSNARKKAEVPDENLNHQFNKK